MPSAGRYSPFIASAVIMAAVFAGWLIMPKIMLMISGAGPVVGALVAVLFILAFFAVLWLRSRYQRRHGN